MQIYPYTYPIILDDDKFVSHGGQTGTTTPAMRSAAYLIAEQQMTGYIGTFLLPTVVTGSMNYFSAPVGSIPTDYGYVSKLLWVRVLDPQDKELYVLSGTYSFGTIADDTFGYLFIENLYHHWNCSNQPFRFQYAYEAGLPTGTASQPGMLVALTGAAQLVINELLPVSANETTGDAGVTDFTSLQYSETRKKWKNTAFGSSAKSAWIAKIIDGTIKKARRVFMLGKI